MARNCQEREVICVPCEKTGYNYKHGSRNKSSSASHITELEKMTDERPTVKGYKPLFERAAEAKTPQNEDT